jgi:hypothetical protein
MKAFGKMRHHCSIPTGIFEVIGASLLLPDWPFQANFLNGIGLDDVSLNHKICTMLGCVFISFALGLVISDPQKRKSLVCWIHFVLATILTISILEGILEDRPGDNPKYLWVVVLLGGQVMLIVMGLGVAVGTLILPKKPSGKQD